jgi:hypothetical protein
VFFELLREPIVRRAVVVRSAVWSVHVTSLR